jgi:hypothetical protein
MASVAQSRRFLAGASTIAIITGLLASVPAAPAFADSYMSGDFHNHTTCTDGSVSLKHMITRSISNFGLEWMATADHGSTSGPTIRDCRFDAAVGVDPVAPQFWDQTLGQTIDGVTITAFKGDVSNANGHRQMWRWQQIDDFVYQTVAQLSATLNNPMIYVGLEHQAPGHEHVSSTVLGAQTPWLGNPALGNASALAEYEFRFDVNDTDFSGKGGTPGVPNSGIWTGKVANAPIGQGTNGGTLRHLQKTVPAVAWMQANYPLSSYFVPAHAERAGTFTADNFRGNGFNVESFRDFNNAGPTVAVGFETMPGHQAAASRGEYQKGFCGAANPPNFPTTCDSVGVTSYGGAGIYAQIGGVWDALLGEGRNWFFFASSDWHSRGSFSPTDRSSTADFYPGEYTRLYIPRPTNGVLRPQTVVDAVRNGNSFSVTGDLITSNFTFTGEDTAKSFVKARMGDTLVVPRGHSVKVTLTVNVPTGPNNSPYSFPNPSLAQLGQNAPPVNQPVLDHIDLITGQITGVIAPGSANYAGLVGSPAATNPTAAIAATFNSSNWVASGTTRTITFTIPNVQNNMYIRARGTNLPIATPGETDAQGNPLSDKIPAEATIPCTDPACPAHLPVNGGIKRSAFDVAAWADLWFYANPIFIRVADQPQLLVEKNKDCARQIAANPSFVCPTQIVATLPPT